MAGVSIDISKLFGPGKRANVHYGLAPWQADRFLITRNSSLGTKIIGMIPLLIGLNFEATALLNYPRFHLGYLIPGVLLALLGILITFGRRHFVLDRKRGNFIDGFGIYSMYWRKTLPLSSFQRVVLQRELIPMGKGQGEIVYTINLDDGSQLYSLGRAGQWENSVAPAESVAAFLHLPLHDAFQDITRAPTELDVPLKDRLRSGQGQADQSVEQPSKGRAKITDSADGILHIHVPRIGPKNPVLGMLVIISVVSLLFGPLAFIIIPFLLICWIKVSFGYSADVEVSPRGLKVDCHGVLKKRTVEISREELEELVFLNWEEGGLAGEIFGAVIKGILVARSDRAAVRFGHGLTKQELLWLRGVILEKVQRSLPDGAPQKQEAGDPIPDPTRPERGGDKRIPSYPWYGGVFPMAGLLAGAVAGHLFPGPLSVCISLPFLEHVLNAGGLIGFLLGFFLMPLSPRGQDAGLPPWWRTPLLAMALLIGLWIALDSPDRWVQPAPRFREAEILALKNWPIEFFLGGWIPTAGLANLVGWTLLLGALCPLTSAWFRALSVRMSPLKKPA